MFNLFKPDTTEKLEARLQATELARLIAERHEVRHALQESQKAHEKALADCEKIAADVSMYQRRLERMKCP